MSKTYTGREVVDTDHYFIVDAFSREITSKDPQKDVLIQNDHNSERFTFEIPRFIEGRDVGKCNLIQVCYTNGRTSGVYTVDDLAVYPFVNDALTCSWLISQNATSRVGPLEFMLRFAQVNADATVEYAWSTKTYSNVKIVESIESAALFETEYVDAIQQWKNSVMEEMSDYVEQTVATQVDVDQITLNRKNISTLAKDASVLIARMDAFSKLSEGSTAGDAELQDIRVGYNGMQYPDAGDAVRGQFDSINESLRSEIGYVYPALNWELGSYTQVSSKDTNRIRTINPVPINGVLTISTLNNQYYVGVRVYNTPSAGVGDYIFDSDWVTGDYTLGGYEGNYFRLCLKRSDEADMSVGERTNLVVRENVNSEATLSQLIANLGDVKSLMTYEFGYIYPYLKWEQGAYTMTSNANKNRIRTSDEKRLATGDIVVKPFDGYRIAIRTYDSKNAGVDEYVTDTGWKTSEFTMVGAAGKYYRLAMARVDDGNITPDDSRNSIVYEIVNTNGTVHKIARSYHLTSNTVRTIAHRGNNIDGPQCTEPAYILARKHGHTIAENDVFNSADGKFVMWHDPTLSRLGNLVDINGYTMYIDANNIVYWYDSENDALYTYTTEYVESSASMSMLTRVSGANYSVTDFPLAVLKRIDFGAWKGPAFKGTQILTFEEWVLLCKKLGMEMYVDRKASYTREGIQELVSTVRKYGMLDKTSWIGVGTTLATMFRDYDPNARIGILENPTTTNVETWKELNGAGRGVFFDGNATTLTEEAVQIGLNAGYDVECYYVDFGSASTSTVFAFVEKLVEWGVNGITTDKYRVDEAFDYLLEKY